MWGEQNHLNIIYIILHTTYSPFLDIFHILSYWTDAQKYCFTSRLFLHSFFRCIKWKSLQILSCGFLQLCQQCRLKVCVNDALAGVFFFKKKSISKMSSIQILFLYVIHWFWKKWLILCNAVKSVSVKKICLTNIASRRIAKVPVNASPLFWEWNGFKDCTHFNWVLTPSIVGLYFNCLICPLQI